MTLEKDDKLSKALGGEIDIEDTEESPVEPGVTFSKLTPDLVNVLRIMNQNQMLQVMDRLASGASVEEVIKEVGKEQVAQIERVTNDQYTTLQAPDVETRTAMGEEDEDAADEILRHARFVPLRLTYDERRFLRLLESTLEVSEYTDKVDVLSSVSRTRRVHQQIKALCSVLAGLVVADDYEAGQELLKERNFSDNQELFAKTFELGRRYKILNPERMRDSYGKLIYFLQDAVSPQMAELLGFDVVRPVQTVYSLLKTKRNGFAMLEDPLIRLATREITADGKSRDQVQREIERKGEALRQLKAKYATKKNKARKHQNSYKNYFRFSFGFGADDEEEDEREASAAAATEGDSAMLGEHLTEDDIEQTVYSLSDHQTFLRFNREPVDKLLKYLDKYFPPNNPTNPEESLGIRGGSEGARLTHDHSRQYAYVKQSLQLWREVLHEMYTLWHLAEKDLLDPSNRARLSDTGQGLQRVQGASSVYSMMSKIVSRVQRKVGGWVGSSVIHLGDHNVPNALIFLDKYTQVPRIVAPLVLAIEKIGEVCERDANVRAYVERSFGGVEEARRMLLRDFFRHGFDGSGAATFFDAGSCIDGRLTSAWNWCSKVEKKEYFPLLLLTGFTGFDGRF